MRHLGMPVLVAALSLCGAACGDDDSGGKPLATSLRDAGNNGRVDGGMGPSGPGDEGAPCRAPGECNAGLNCVQNIFTVGICARGCATDASCDSGERCFSYTDADADKHCVNIVTEEYGLCGVGYTSLCDGKRACLYAPDLPIGVCVDLCGIDSAAVADAGIEDGGVSSTGPAGTVACRSSETCVDGVLAQPDPNEGVCGMVVDRGAECGTDRGLFCQPSDLCAPEDLDVQDSAWRCFQDCSSGQKCEQGTCTMVKGFATYCL